MTLFDRAFSLLLSYEGGYSNDPNDPGGRTLYGISEKSHPLLWQHAPPTKEQAKDLYYTQYWLPAHCPDFPQPIALLVFDSAVNLGVSQSLRLLQRSLSVPEDGLWGPVSQQALATEDIGQVQQNFLTERALFYADLPHWRHFRRGWIRRLFDLAHYASLLELYPVP